VRWLQSAPRADTRLASICSGALLLAQAGWLTGRHCTTHHSLIHALQAYEPTALVEADRILVDDGGVLTSAGITTASTWRCTSWSGTRVPSWRHG
jgi:transcriptional regulator GlxA family with amidase domain